MDGTFRLNLPALQSVFITYAVPILWFLWRYLVDDALGSYFSASHFSRKIEKAFRPLETAISHWCCRLRFTLFKSVLRIRIHMFLGLLDPDPDPLVRCMDPRIQIQIHNKGHGSAY
jgi:hypothetical protein